MTLNEYMYLMFLKECFGTPLDKVNKPDFDFEVSLLSVVCPFPSVNSMLITGTITAKQKVRQKVPGLYAVCR